MSLLSLIFSAACITALCYILKTEPKDTKQNGYVFAVYYGSICVYHETKDVTECEAMRIALQLIHANPLFEVYCYTPENNLLTSSEIEAAKNNE